MRKNISRALLVGTVLSATVALGVGPSFAEMDPAAAGISDADWQRVVEIGDYNGALVEYVDNAGQPIMVFTGGKVPDQLQWPADFTGFDNPDLTFYGEYSQFASNDQVSTITDAVTTQVANAGYNVGVTYDNDTDQIDVITLAPSSVTSALVTQYGNKIHIAAADPSQQTQTPSGTAHGHTKKHTPKKHKAKKNAAKKHTAKKHTTAAKKAAGAAPAQQEPAKVVLKLAPQQ
ncbi:hypothetical protein ABZ490_44065 [Streptomyces sp. NPDC005811]|uniref:hypothetical protein n=1 Tax=Streptomyces sp. NPDC005811 TaxID=3154565 RepID=UPI0033EF3453